MPVAERVASAACGSRAPSVSPRDKASFDETGDGGFEEITPDEPTGEEVGGSLSDHCYDEYLKIIATCKKLPKKADRAICYVAAMDWYVNCKFPMPSCRKNVAATRVSPIAARGTIATDDVSECDTDPGSGGGGGGGGGGTTPTDDCGWEEWQISYDGGFTWEYWGTFWTCYVNAT